MAHRPIDHPRRVRHDHLNLSLPQQWMTSGIRSRRDDGVARQPEIHLTNATPTRGRRRRRGRGCRPGTSGPVLAKLKTPSTLQEERPLLRIQQREVLQIYRRASTVKEAHLHGGSGLSVPCASGPADGHESVPGSGRETDQHRGGPARRVAAEPRRQRGWGSESRSLRHLVTGDTGIRHGGAPSGSKAKRSTPPLSPIRPALPIPETP